MTMIVFLATKCASYSSFYEQNKMTPIKSYGIQRHCKYLLVNYFMLSYMIFYANGENYVSPSFDVFLDEIQQNTVTLQ